MKLAVERVLLKRLLKWGQRGLFTCAALLLGYCGYALVDAWMFQRREGADLDRRLQGQGTARETAAQPGPSATPPIIAAIAPDGLIGRIEIARLQLSVVVMEGIDRTTLRRAVGHIPGTALPGQSGNVGLAGHRDTFFRSLKDARIKDEVQIKTLQGDFTYEIESLRIVNPDNVGVLAASGGNVLTLVTCYPFYYVGPAPQRYIVRARQVVP